MRAPLALLAALALAPTAAAGHAWSGTRPIELAPHEPSRLAILLAGAALGILALAAAAWWRRGRETASLRGMRE